VENKAIVEIQAIMYLAEDGLKEQRHRRHVTQLTVSVVRRIRYHQNNMKIQQIHGPRYTDHSRTALASSRPADTIQDRDAGQQMSAGPSIPVSR